jgi:TPR repeat protein
MNRRYLVAAAFLIATAAPLSAQSVKAGIDAWQRADYAAAVGIWKPLAEQGDPDAQFNLGQAYRLGRGVQTNLAAAKSWFERAAEQGHVDAQTTLGLLLFQNNDQAEGLKWLKKASDQGEPRAMLVYGTALVNGDSVTQDPVLGYAYVSRAAAQGLDAAKDTLAQLDKLLPAADRKHGAQIARQLGKGSPAMKTARAAPGPVETASAEPPPRPARRSSKPATAKPTVAKEAAKETAAKEPSAAPDTVDSPPAAAGAWRIQLGAFAQSGSAEALYQRLSGKEALAGRQPFYVAAGAVTRLQVGPFESKSAAQAACRSVGIACFPVPPR